ncbi:MAG TPA: hypothetical protein VME18_06030 [Acidobacteriaceae bacterium]|nr:hypothetical protein [Acidobacteriaceae bacterium]
MRVFWKWCGLVLALGGLTSVGLAQSGEANAALKSCGPFGVNFRIKTADTRPAAKIQPGTALVYFIADDHGTVLTTPTTLVGLDGQWVGASHGSSWLYLQVPPREHHLCAMTEDAGKALAHFTAAAGGVYYFVAKDLTWEGYTGWTELSLEPLDSDEGQYLVDTEAFSASQKR